MGEMLKELAVLLIVGAAFWFTVLTVLLWALRPKRRDTPVDRLTKPHLRLRFWIMKNVVELLGPPDGCGWLDKRRNWWSIRCLRSKRGEKR